MDLRAALPEEIAQALAPLGEPPYRGIQVFTWIQQKGASDFAAMTDLPKTLREYLCEHFTVSTMAPSLVLTSRDGTVKMLFDVDGNQFASVLMPFEGRVTLCVSTQIGCRMGCKFCKTATVGFGRNLTAEEIAGQVAAARAYLGGDRRLSNVVFMGMGEPLDNVDNVLRAIRVITHRRGMAIAPRRTTVSTVGVVRGMRRFLESGVRASLAVSLCGTTDEQRRLLCPAARKNTLEEIVQVLESHRPPPGWRYTIEYLLLGGLTDSVSDARRLSRLLARFPAKVNLIPFNPWPGCSFRPPAERSIQRFKALLESKNHTVNIRESRGVDIGAGCGQLGFKQV